MAGSLRVAMLAGALLGGALFARPASAVDLGCMYHGLGLPLAGPDAVDCGIVASDNERGRKRAIRCAQRAIAAGQPVRVGTGFWGGDVLGCDVVVVDDERQYWLISLFQDFSLDMKVPEVFVGRCPTIDLDWQDPNGQGRFGPRDCPFDDEAFEVLKASF